MKIYGPQMQLVNLLIADYYKYVGVQKLRIFPYLLS